MKKITHVYRDIEEVHKNAPPVNAQSKNALVLKKRANTKLKFLRLAALYLETNPSEVFVRKQLELISKCLQTAKDGLSSISRVSKDKDEVAARAAYKGLISQCNTQLKMINYILR